MIDLTDYKTIPSEVGFIVREFVDQLPNKGSLIQDEIPPSNIEVRCRLEDYFRPSSVPALYESLASILESEEIIVYHATKVLSPDKIKYEGLRINSWEHYSNYVNEAFIKGGISEVETEVALHHIKTEKKRRDHFGQDVLCYFANRISFSEEERTGYLHFCQNIGGELARNALEKTMPSLYKVLCDSGESVLVKFSIPFSWIADYEIEDKITHFIYHIAASYLWNYMFDIEFDGSLFQDVPASSIIDVISVEPPVFLE